MDSRLKMSGMTEGGLKAWGMTEGGLKAWGMTEGGLTTWGMTEGLLWLSDLVLMDLGVYPLISIGLLP